MQEIPCSPHSQDGLLPYIDGLSTSLLKRGREPWTKMMATIIAQGQGDVAGTNDSTRKNSKKATIKVTAGHSQD
jgi:hypothetical protein